MLLVGFYFWEMEVNKQQLIDKAIDDLKLAVEDPFFGKRFLCRTQLTDGRFAYYGTGYPHHTDDLVCAKHEFQARKAERELWATLQSKGWKKVEGASGGGYGRIIYDPASATKPIAENSGHWYDYENQKALRLPPVDESVQVRLDGGGAWHEAYTVGTDNGVCVVRSKLGFDLAYDIRPLDWNKKKSNELQELTGLINGSFITTDPEGIAVAILAAGYRKCDNKTTSDKE